MGNPLKQLLILMMITLSFSTNARAQDPIAGCWQMDGTMKATATLLGRSASQRDIYADIVCFNTDNTFNDSNGYGTWEYQKNKYILNYDLSSLDAALAPLITELQNYGFDNVYASLNSAVWALKLKNNQLKGSANLKGKGSLDYNGRTFNFRFTLKVTVKNSSPTSLQSSYKSKNVESAKGVIKANSKQLSGIMESTIKDVEELLMQKAE